MKSLRNMQRTASAAALAVLALAVSTIACDKKQAPVPSPDAAVEQSRPAAEVGPLEAPRIPTEPAKFGPSLAQVKSGEHYDVDTLMETALCEGCHGQIVGEWKESSHAFASMSNPYYRHSFDQFVADADDPAKAKHCAGCHDPTLLFDGSITAGAEPKDRRSHVGVTCNTCHGVVEATTEGNGSYVLTTATVPIPKDGDDHSLAKHRARLGAAVVKTNEMCVTCHQGFFSPATGHDVIVSGLAEFTLFRRSGYAGNSVTRIDQVQEKKCTDCHMPRGGPDNLPSHRFAGGHSSLAAAIGAPEQLAAIEEMVRGAATVDIGAIGVGEVKLGPAPANLAKGDNVWIDVVVYNVGTGHTFPGGALDLRDTWIEIELLDAGGKKLGSAGQQHEKEKNDPSAVVLRAIVADKEGGLVGRHRAHSFRTAVAKHVVAPRDALVSRYTWEVGDTPVKLPLTARAILKHRRLNHTLADKACAESKTARGKEFAAETKRFFGFDVDPCRPQPVIEVGRAAAQLGGDLREGVEKPEWRRQWERGLGLMHNVQENLPEAIDAFQNALKMLPKDAPKLEQARVQFSLGVAAAGQGRTQDAMDFWGKAEELMGPHAAIHFARGSAHQRTFRNEEAVKWYQEAAKLVDDDRVWRQLAIAAGSIGEARVAYDAARAGLLQEPRDPHLLRSQMLSLRKLDEAKPEWVEAASQAFSGYKRDEAAPSIRDKCSAEDPYCRDEREPMRITPLH